MTRRQAGAPHWSHRLYRKWQGRGGTWALAHLALALGSQVVHLLHVHELYQVARHGGADVACVQRGWLVLGLQCPWAKPRGTQAAPKTGGQAPRSRHCSRTLLTGSFRQSPPTEGPLGTPTSPGACPRCDSELCPSASDVGADPQVPQDSWRRAVHTHSPAPLARGPCQLSVPTVPRGLGRPWFFSHRRPLLPPPAPFPCPVPDPHFLSVEGQAVCGSLGRQDDASLYGEPNCFARGWWVGGSLPHTEVTELDMCTSTASDSPDT